VVFFFFPFFLFFSRFSLSYPSSTSSVSYSLLSTPWFDRCCSCNPPIPLSTLHQLHLHRILIPSPSPININHHKTHTLPVVSRYMYIPPPAGPPSSLPTERGGYRILPVPVPQALQAAVDAFLRPLTELRKREIGTRSADSNVTIGVIVGVVLGLFLLGIIAFLWTYRLSIKFSYGKKRRRKSGSSKSSKSSKSSDGGAPPPPPPPPPAAAA
jgi:hypothetical protein